VGLTTPRRLPARQTSVSVGGAWGRSCLQAAAHCTAMIASARSPARCRPWAGTAVYYDPVNNVKVVMGVNGVVTAFQVPGRIHCLPKRFSLVLW